MYTHPWENSRDLQKSTIVKGKKSFFAKPHLFVGSNRLLILGCYAALYQLKTAGGEPPNLAAMFEDQKLNHQIQVRKKKTSKVESLS